MKKLINEPTAVVREMMEGLALAHPGLALLEGETVLLRTDADRLREAGKVALIAGGGAGHEPAHAGYVGPGMLTAAVSGDVFTSPSTDAVLAAIRAVGGPQGVLLIIKNYTGDRLHFGLAAELARAEGIPVETVVVADDVALAASTDLAGRRGIAGTVLVHKIAGAAADAGLSLAEVQAAAQRAADRVGTMGVALTPCTVPAAGKPGFELGAGELELGLGIHGEAGVQRAKMMRADAVVDVLLEKIAADRGLARGDRVVLLANNLGGTPAMEMTIVLRRALQRAAAMGLVVERAWAGPFLTAIEMAGCSLTLMKVDDDDLARLDAATTAPAWPAPWLGSVAPKAGLVAKKPRAEAEAPPPATRLAASPDVTRHVLTTVARAWLDAEAALPDLDRVVSDGDLGLSLARGAHALGSELASYDLADPAATLRAVSGTLRRSMAGTSGALYAIGLLRMASALERGASWGAAVHEACDAIATVGGARVGDRTMLDALVPAAEALAAAASRGAAPGAALQDAAIAARRGSDRTKAMQPRRGRSTYLGDRVAGHVDPGAEAIVVLFDALAQALT